MKNWRILVVDDDNDVLETTRFTLEYVRALDRGIEIVGCTSAAQVEQLLAHDTDFAVILLDVQMESPTAGLKLIHRIRETYGMHMTRILLRTGQPGVAPESDIIFKYEIDDYILKESATNKRLVTATVTAIRAYDLILRLSRMQSAMGIVLRCSNELMEQEMTSEFTEVLSKFATQLLGKDMQGLYFLAPKPVDGVNQKLVLVGSSENLRFSQGSIDHMLMSEEDFSEIMEVIDQVDRNKISSRDWNERIEYFSFPGNRRGLLWMRKPDGYDAIDEQVVDHFMNTVDVASTRMILANDRIKKAVVSIAILAHEFRTPIAALRMSNEHMLGTMDEPAPDLKGFKGLLDNVEQILQRMSNHIDISLKNAGVVMRSNLELASARKDVSKIITKAMEVHKGLFPKGAQVKLELEENCFAEVEATTLEQVFLNLAKNAVRAVTMRKFPVSGHEYEVQVSKRANHVVLRVTDYGEGIAQQNLDKIYAPFFSSSNTPSLGLGLAMVKKSVEAMGGTVTCTSERDVKTTFEIALPAVA